MVWVISTCWDWPLESHPNFILFSGLLPPDCFLGPVSLDVLQALWIFQFSSVAQSCPTLCDPMNRSTPSLPVHHHLPEFTQTQVHRVSDAIQPSHPRSSPCPPAPNPSQHQSLFQWVNTSHEVAKVLEFQLYYHSFQRNPRVDLLQNGLVGSKGLSWVFSSTTFQKHQFFSTQPSSQSNSYIHTWPQEKS